MAGYIGEADILVGADASRFEAGLCLLYTSDAADEQ